MHISGRIDNYGNLLIIPKSPLYILLKSNFNVSWKLTRNSINPKIFSLKLYLDINGYLSRSDNEQPHYLSSYVEAKIIDITQNKYLTEDANLQKLKIPTKTHRATIYLVFYAALGIVQLSVPNTCIDSCLSEALKSNIGLSAHDIDNKIYNYHILLQQILSIKKFAAIVNLAFKRKFYQLTDLELLTVNTIKFALARYGKFNLDYLQLTFSFDHYKIKYPKLLDNLRFIMPSGNITKQIYETNLKLALCAPFYTPYDIKQPCFISGSASTIAHALSMSLSHTLSLDDHFMCIGLVHQLDQEEQTVYYIDGISDYIMSDKNTLNSSRIIAIAYFSTLALIQGTVPCEAQKEHTTIKGLDKIVFTDAILYLLGQASYADLIYQFVKSLKFKKVSDIALNLIKPILSMALIKQHNLNLIDFSKISIKKTLYSIKKILDSQSDHYPYLWEHLSPLTPDEIRYKAIDNSIDSSYSSYSSSIFSPNFK